MKVLKENHTAISTLLAFALIPLSGFATDIYIPSFPTMAKFFGTSQTDIQLTLIVFIVSSGVSQLFVGSLLDSFGRYRITLASLTIFALSCFVIALSHNIGVVLAMRVIQGVAVALIVVSKRAFFMDVYSGDRLKNYTSSFSIIWATAPIVAPFIGGFLQQYFGWESNFYFLGGIALTIMALEFIYGGETIKKLHSFKLTALVDAYASKLSKMDFALSLVILGLSYSMVMVFNMAAPFIIEHVFHQSPVITGNSSLLSGVAIMAGGLLSKASIHRSLDSKMNVLGFLLVGLSVVMIAILNLAPGLYTLMATVVVLHVVSGFTFNTFFTYALNRFGTNAGLVSGLTGGGAYMVTSIVSFATVSVIDVKSISMLGVGYLIISVLLIATFALFALTRRNIAVPKTEAALQ